MIPLQMKSNITDFDSLHDVMIEIDGKSRTEEELLEIFLSLPEHIQHIAHEWSCSDTVFGDESYTYLSKKHNDKP